MVDSLPKLVKLKRSHRAGSVDAVALYLPFARTADGRYGKAWTRNDHNQRFTAECYGKNLQSTTKSYDMTFQYMDFECMICGKMFEERWFDIGRAFERVHFRSPDALDEVEVSFADGIGVFCSQGCLDAGRATLMQEEGVPIPSVRPGIGPVEQCARCAGPVDMSDWHLTYTDGQYLENQGGVRVIEIDYIAVACRECAPRNGESAVALAEERDEGRQVAPIKVPVDTQ